MDFIFSNFKKYNFIYINIIVSVAKKNEICYNLKVCMLNVYEILHHGLIFGLK